MESFSFELKLVDSVTAVGRRQAKAVDDIQVSAKKAQAELQRMGRIQSSAMKLDGLFDAKKVTTANKALEAQSRAAAKLESQVRKTGLAQLEAAKMNEAFDKKKKGFFGGFSQKLGMGSVSDIAKGAFVGEMAANAVMGIAGAFVSGAEKAASILYEGLKSAFASASTEETQRIGERNILGEKGGKDFAADIQRFDKMTPFDDGDIRKMMLDLRKAGISQDASRQMFGTAVDLGGGDEGEVSGLLSQFKNIYTKHGIGKKQLVGILGDVGETIPDFYKALGKKMHVSAKEAAKRAESNRVDPQLIMNMITEAQNKRQGGAAGTGGNRFADSIAGQWKKVKNLPNEFYKQFVDAPGYAKARKSVSKILEAFDPKSPRGQRIFSVLGSTFEWVAEKIEKAVAYLTSDEFSKGFAAVIDFGGTLFSIFGSVWDIATDIVGVLGDMGVGALLKGIVDSVSFLVKKLEQLLKLAREGTEILTGHAADSGLDRLAKATQAKASLQNVIASPMMARSGVTMHRGDMQIGDFGVAASSDVARGGARHSVQHIVIGDIHVTGSHSGDPHETGAKIAASIKHHAAHSGEQAGMEGG